MNSLATRGRFLDNPFTHPLVSSMPVLPVRKAVLPAAGLGTRFLPATKASPKEMLPLVDKPLIQYAVEEAVASGIEDIIIVTGRGKRAIEDHFDRSFELEENLKGNKKEGMRDGARAGDLLYVTGTLGDSLAGLKLLSSRKRAKTRSMRSIGETRLIRRHLRPSPRVEIGHLLSAHRLATAAIDVSDGLSGDLRHICTQSGVGVEVDAQALPLSSELRTYAHVHAMDPVAIALQGGEDYELLFTVSPRNRAKLLERCRQMTCRMPALRRFSNSLYFPAPEKAMLS